MTWSVAEWREASSCSIPSQTTRYFLPTHVIPRGRSIWSAQMIMNKLQHWLIYLPLLASTFLDVMKELANTLHPLFTLFFCYGHKYVTPVGHTPTHRFYNPHLLLRHPTGTPFCIHAPQQTFSGLNQETRLRADFHSSSKRAGKHIYGHKIFLFLCTRFLLWRPYLYKMRNNFHSKENKATIMKKWLVSAGYIDIQHLHTHMVLHQQNHAFRELLAARQDTMNHEQAQHRMYLNLEIKDHTTYSFLLPSRKYCIFSPV